MELYLAVLLGSFIYMLIQLNEVFHLRKFRWRIFFRTNILPFIINITLGVTCVFARDELNNIYPITFISSVILGVSGQHIWKKITLAFDKTQSTAIGINK
jgi:hypothetical protein